MGRIKSKEVKKTAEKLIQELDGTSSLFEKNKRILGNTLPSKKIRNKVAGYMTRLNKNAEKKKRAQAVIA